MLKATYNDKEIILDILCESFDSNKSVNYVVKQDGQRRKRIRTLMNYSFEICYKFGQLYLSDDKQACALILFPDKKKTSLTTILLDVKLAFLSIGLTRVIKVLKRDTKIKSAYPVKTIFYLWFIGVHTSSQHKGIGSNLLMNIIDESIQLERPIYLETSMPDNIRFYKKLGFDVYKELKFDYPLYLMRRSCIST